jgi:hypothetical protein
LTLSTVAPEKEINLVCRSKANYFSKEPSYRKWRSDLELADLPEVRECILLRVGVEIKLNSQTLGHRE